MPILKTSDIKSIFPGKYPQASYQLLTQSDIELKSKEDLKIMRNEIFARYGYIFKKGGDMDTYFKSQEWYTPQTKNVNEYLTDIEKHNIKFIKTYEKR